MWRLTVLIISMFWALPAAAQSTLPPATWTKVHSITIDLAQGRHDVVLPVVDDRGDQPRSRAFRIVATSGNIVLTRITATYATGQMHFEDRRINLREGERTRPINARDDAMVLEAMSFSYERATAGGSATLTIWSLQEPVDPRSRFTPRTVGGGELLFTEVQVMFGTPRQQDANRKKAERTLATFNGNFGTGLSLGRAIVTVPKQREAGSLSRPEIDMLLTRFEYRREDPSRDFTLAAIDVLPEAGFINSVNSQMAKATTFRDHVFVFIHGYNTSFDDALYRAAQLAHDMEFDGVPVVYSWPSRGGTLDYRHDVDAAKASRKGLSDLLELIAGQTKATHINIIAHSMGNDPLLEVLSQRRDVAAAGGKVADLKLNEVVLAVPDVSRSVFEQQARDLHKMTRGGITLYASSTDRALAASKKIAGGIVRAGDISTLGPPFVPGLQIIDISKASTAMFALNHTTFAERAQIVLDLAQLLKGGTRPPNVRTEAFKPIGSGLSLHWLFEARN